jgi:hypothetical protein
MTVKIGNTFGVRITIVTMPASPTDPVIAWAGFYGGPRRPVYEDADGGQYVK